MMKFIISVVVLMMFSATVKSQTLENKLVAAACHYIDSLPIAKIITQEDKKAVITFIFAKTVAANQKAINNDKRFKGLAGYEQGKKLGQLMAKNILPIMNANCQKLKKFAS